jgi:hypothetical protein
MNAVQKKTFILAGAILLFTLISIYTLRTTLQKKIVYEPKASKEKIRLMVSNKVISKTSNQILGQATTLTTLPFLKMNTFKSMMTGIKPPLIRFPHFRYFWQRSHDQNSWIPSFKSQPNINITGDKKLYTKEGGNVYQLIDASRFEKNKRYRFGFKFKKREVGGASTLRGGLVEVVYLENDPWWKDNTRLAKIDIGNGSITNFQEAHADFNYHFDDEKKPVFIKVLLGLKTSGNVWFDEVKLYPLDQPNNNLINDSGFSQTFFPPINYQFRFTSKDLDEMVLRIKNAGAQPVFILNQLNTLTLDLPNPQNALELERKVLNHPQLNRAIKAELDILKYTNKEKGYGIKYWEFGNEPEIWWTWIDKRYNYGTNSNKVRQRYKLYGILYSKYASRAKKIDPSIKIGVALVWREHWKDSVDGFFEGLKEAQERYGVRSPIPDFFSPHPYQLRAWGETPACPKNNVKLCIDNLLTYQEQKGAAYCSLNDYRIIKGKENLDHISYFDAYLTCLKAYLKEQKQVDKPRFIFTEWEASGSSGSLYGRFGDEIWAADRLGRFAQFGEKIAAIHWYLGMDNGIVTRTGKINSPYTTFGLYSNFIKENTNVLEAKTNSPDKVSIYAFQNGTSSSLYIVMVNLIRNSGFTPVRIFLPEQYLNRSQIKELRLTCKGKDCLYERNVTRLNGKLVTNKNILRLLSNPPWQNINYKSNGSYNLANHSVTIWKINKIEKQSPSQRPSSGCNPPQTSGNANCDGAVDLLDYSIWLNSTCEPASSQRCLDTRADFNHDKMINLIDKTIWLKHCQICRV